MDVTPYWESWAPHLHFFEDTFLDLESIEKLTSVIQDPVLVVGAGQGLLVERLRAKGFDVDGVELSANMIKYAKKRRGIDLVQADARKMPFADGTYETSIITTGD
jgi:predicted TPR repeat methyltransferase